MSFLVELRLGEWSNALAESYHAETLKALNSVQSPVSIKSDSDNLVNSIKGIIIAALAAFDVIYRSAICFLQININALGYCIWLVTDNKAFLSDFDMKRASAQAVKIANYAEIAFSLRIALDPEAQYALFKALDLISPKDEIKKEIIDPDDVLEVEDP